ncbi:MAG: DsbA family protein [Pseudomonadota bacterium]|nr:DsbA family protein [Pseudomonadota bacterium]
MLLGVDGGAATAPAAEASPDASICALLWESGAPAEGPADGRPRIAVFSDANCPYCRTLDGILAELAEARPDLRVAHHEWPVLGPGSVVAARAALAAARQGRFRALKTRLLDAAFAINPAYIAAVAPPLGIDADRLAADMAAPEVDRILAATDAAARRFGFAGTPSLVIGGTVAAGARSRARIEALLDAEAARDHRPCG